jgi:hypothetical protein
VLDEQPCQGGSSQWVVVDEKNPFSHGPFSSYRRACFCRQE